MNYTISITEFERQGFRNHYNQWVVPCDYVTNIAFDEPISADLYDQILSCTPRTVGQRRVSRLGWFRWKYETYEECAPVDVVLVTEREVSITHFSSSISTAFHKNLTRLLIGYTS